MPGMFESVEGQRYRLRYEDSYIREGTGCFRTYFSLSFESDTAGLLRAYASNMEIDVGWVSGYLYEKGCNQVHTHANTESYNRGIGLLEKMRFTFTPLKESEPDFTVNRVSDDRIWIRFPETPECKYFSVYDGRRFVYGSVTIGIEPVIYVEKAKDLKIVIDDRIYRIGRI